MNDKILSVASPESVGVPSKAVRAYIEGMSKRGINIHSFLMMRGDEIFAEGYCQPYNEGKLQRLYSVSKSFTSAAVGLMIDEGKIDPNGRIVDYFPEFVPKNPHKWLLDTTVENMLKMTTPFEKNMHCSGAGPWVKAYLNCPVNHPPGTVFAYDTAAPHTLCALVEKLSGKTMLEYLREKLAPISLSEDARCIKGTDGYSWGGSGIMATLRDMAKLAYVFNNGGKFRGRQLISEEYVKNAVSYQSFNDTMKDGNLWRGGYGYQIWLSKDNAFAFRGMGAQHAVCLPDKDFVFCCTADCQGSVVLYQMIYEELRNRIIPLLGEPMAENPIEYELLIKCCADMKLAVTQGAATSPICEKVNGSVYDLQDNRMQISELSFHFNSDEGCIHYTTPRGEKEIKFGFGRHVEYTFPETHYFGEQIDVPSGKGYRTWASGAWKDEHTLFVRSETLDEYLGVLNMTFSFKDEGEELGIMMNKTAEWFFDEYQGVAGGTKRKQV